jgi:hypothetical protein
MAIRFRCCYCHQLLAIAQRKVGMVTKCPTCLGQVWVPDPEQPEEEQSEPTQTNAPNQPAAPQVGPMQAPLAPRPAGRIIAGSITVVVFVVFFFVLGVLIGRGLH